MTAPIYVNDDLVEAFFRQRLDREKQIASGVKALAEKDEIPVNEQELLDVVFPQRFDQCIPSFGKPCMFKKICHGFVADPLAEGYIPREPHHQMERDQLGLE